jgi:hypothetical protein
MCAGDDVSVASLIRRWSSRDTGLHTAQIQTVHSREGNEGVVWLASEHMRYANPVAGEAA